MTNERRKQRRRKVREYLVTKVVSYIQKRNKLPTIATLGSRATKSKIQSAFGNFATLLSTARRQHPESFSGLKTYEQTQRENVLRTFCELVLKNNSLPDWNQMAKAGYKYNMVKLYYSRYEDLEGAARKFNPDAFRNLIDKTIFNKVHTDALAADVARYKRFVVTTAVVGCPVDAEFLASIHRYCRKNEAKLLVLSSADPAAKTTWMLDAALGREHVVVTDLRLNQNVFLSTIKLSAKHIDPITGLSRLGQRNGTFIYASPKQRLEFVAMGNNTRPHALMTTGAVTKPQYQTERYLSERTAYIATQDHVIGAVVVELEDDGRGFHFRQIQADHNGAFIDLGQEYSRKGIREVPAAAVVLGDWHAGETDPSARIAWKNLCKIVHPAEVFIHDGFNGLSINPHERDQQITRAMDASNNLLSLENEIEVFAKDLKVLSKWATERVVVVKSNHDVFLERYLQEGLYTQDPQNHKFALQLANEMLNGRDPLRAGVDRACPGLNKVLWLQLDDDYLVAGIQLGAHGHLGPNGSRNPGMAALEKAYGACVTGHTHSAAILRNAYRVGTSSVLKPRYNVGPSSWTRTSCIVYPNGARQLINVFNEHGRWNTLCKKP